MNSTDPTCGENNGSITFTYADSPNRTNIEFSIDGGVTYPYDPLDDSGTFTVSNLQADTYDLWTRWGNGECPVDLPNVTLIDPVCIYDLALTKVETSAGPYVPGDSVSYDICVVNHCLLYTSPSPRD